MTPHEVALAAQHIETEMLEQQCGIQDQLCSAYGGINYIEMFQYPHASVSQITGAQLDLVGAGAAAGADLPGQVAQLVPGARDGHPRAGECRAGLPAAGRPAPDGATLARCAVRGDFAALGQAMTDNTEAQRRLHPALVSPDAAADDRDRPGARRAGLEGQRRRRRRRLADPAVRRPAPTSSAP